MIDENLIRQWRQRGVEIVASAQSEAEAEQNAEHDRRHMLCDRQRAYKVPPHYVGALVAHFQPADVQGAPWLFQRPLPPARSLYIRGDNGTGKTHLAAALAGEWCATWANATELLRRIRSTYRQGAEESESEIVNDAIRRRVLVLDDVSAIAATEHGLATILAIVDGRIGRDLPTIVTSFHALAHVHTLDSSLASRLGGFEQVKVVGADRRLR